MATEIKRGDIYWISWSPGRGNEQAGLRPALIIQNDTGNKFSSTTIVASCSTVRKREYPFIVNVAAGESGFSAQDFHINTSQIMTVDKSRLRERFGRLSDDVMEKVDRAIAISLDL